jgi:hypothetical protein
MMDTSSEAWTRYFELLENAGPQRRLEMCLSLSRTVRELAIAGIKSAHAGRELTPQELRWRLAERLYGRAVAERFFDAPRA